jgi:hypothetical protein
VAPAEVAHRSTTLCLISDIAMRLGRKLRWDPATETFPGDDEANRMLARSMRAPWTLCRPGARHRADRSPPKIG